MAPAAKLRSQGIRGCAQAASPTTRTPKIGSKRAELQTLQEQISQQQTKNEEMQRILSGDSDEVTEWVARDSYNYAAANERIFVDVTGN